MVELVVLVVQVVQEMVVVEVMLTRVVGVVLQNIYKDTNSNA